MHIAICDSDQEYSQRLCSILNSYFEDSNYSAKTEKYLRLDDLFFEIYEEVHFDIIFLRVEDSRTIDMFAEKIKENSNVITHLIIISSSTEFAVEGYELGASGYLLKPFEKPMIERIMKRLSIGIGSSEYIVKQKSSIFKIPYDRIRYVESSNTKCLFHTTEGKNYTLYKRLNDIEKELSDDRFLRCHRSYIVNMNFIVNAEKDFLLENGERVLIRQKSLKDIKEKYLYFIEHQKNLSNK